MESWRHTRSASSIAVLLASALVLLGAAWDGIPEGMLSASAAGSLARAVGSAEVSVLARVAAALPGEDIIVACYRGTRAERLVALSVAAHAGPGGEVLPYLAALAGSRQRETASRAAGSLLAALQRLEASAEADYEFVPGQADQLASQCLDLARDRRLAPDLRLVGLTSGARIARLGKRQVPPPAELFDDRESALRGGALALLDVPLGRDDLARVARMASADADPVLRGQAAGLLCENALAHRVAEPSADLARVMRDVADDERVPPDGLAPLLGCLVRFSPIARAGLVERVLSRDRPGLAELWKALGEGQEAPREYQGREDGPRARP
jgi:hypothetical protein